MYGAAMTGILIGRVICVVIGVWLGHKRGAPVYGFLLPALGGLPGLAVLMFVQPRGQRVTRW